MIIKILIVAIFLLGLVYMVAPMPTSISQIAALPNSLKSKDPGDTYQVPNVAAYYTEMWRVDVMSYYKNNLESLNFWGIKVPPLDLNHPPEEAYQDIEDQERSTYLEELVYPLRESLFVNGYEPVNQNGQLFNNYFLPMFINGKFYNSKVTLRLYPSSLKNRILGYLGIWLSLILLFYLTKRAVKEQV